MSQPLRLYSTTLAIATAAAAPALGQDAAPTISIPAPAASTGADDAVGPVQLRDFSLTGTVTRRAEQPVRGDGAAPASSVASANVQAEAGRRAVALAPAPARATPPAPDQLAAPAAQSQVAARTFDFGTPTPSGDGSIDVAPAPSSETGSHPAVASLVTGDMGGSWLSLWPWLLALIAAAGAAIWYFQRPRTRYGFASAGGDVSAFDLPSSPAPSIRPSPRTALPEQPPVSRAPIPVPPPSGGVVSTRLRLQPEDTPAAAPIGIVSSRLRPWIDLDFAPVGATIDDNQAVIELLVTAFNSGSAPARDIALEALPINAGPDQDEAIGAFFSKTASDGERIAVLPPLQRMEFRSQVVVPRSGMRLFDAGGRSVWVPLIGFNAFYRWSGGEGQTSASYIIGRDTAGEKMAPFRIEQGARRFDRLGSHPLDNRIRR